MKNNILIILSIFSLSFHLTLSAQEQDGVVITSSQIRCTDHKNGTDNNYISLKIQNTNNYKVTVQFQKQMWYDGNCVNCDKQSDEYSVNLTLEPNQMIEGLCDKKDFQLLIFHSMPNGLTTTKLTDFKLTKLQVSLIK